MKKKILPKFSIMNFFEKSFLFFCSKLFFKKKKEIKNERSQNFFDLSECTKVVIHQALALDFKYCEKI